MKLPYFPTKSLHEIEGARDFLPSVLEISEIEGMNSLFELGGANCSAASIRIFRLYEQSLLGILMGSARIPTKGCSHRGEHPKASW